jgi:hypothetical protein
VPCECPIRSITFAFGGVCEHVANISAVARDCSGCVMRITLHVSGGVDLVAGLRQLFIAVGVVEAPSSAGDALPSPLLAYIA